MWKRSQDLQIRRDMLLMMASMKYRIRVATLYTKVSNPNIEISRLLLVTKDGRHDG